MQKLIKQIGSIQRCLKAGFIKTLLSIFNFWGRPINYHQWKNNRSCTGLMKKDDWQKAYQAIKARQTAQAA